MIISAALREVLSTLTNGPNVETLEEARESVGNDMVGLMTRVFPIVTQVMIEVIQNYGFSPDGVGKNSELCNHFYLIIKKSLILLIKLSYFTFMGRPGQTIAIYREK